MILLLALLGCDPEPSSDNVDEDGDGVVAGTDRGKDCDDHNAAVNPHAPEICDGIDNNCDGNVDEDVAQTFHADADGDGFGDPFVTERACATGPGLVKNALDCDDAEPLAYPSAVEVCDGIDNDCDAQVDEAVTTTFYADADGDGHGVGGSTTEACAAPDGFADSADDCDDADALAYPGAPEVCDGRDQSCDGIADEGVTVLLYRDADGDGSGDPFGPTQGCEGTGGLSKDKVDCDDTDPTVYGGAPEQCDGVDDDCDGQIDEGAKVDVFADVDGDGFGDPATATPACAPGSGQSANGDDCDDADGAVHPGAKDVCDGRDEDCDGDIDEDEPVDVWLDADGDGYGVGTASSGCPGGGWAASAGDCDDAEPSVRPGAPERCNGIDDDCSGDVDEDAHQLWWPDDDLDGFGDGAASPIDTCAAVVGRVTDPRDCDDDDPERNPLAEEIDGDGIDADCDGLDGPGACALLPAAAAVGQRTCSTSAPGTFGAKVEWALASFLDFGTHAQVTSTPVVGQLTDDDANGKIDDADLPDVAFVSHSGTSKDAIFRVVSGDGAKVHHSWGGATIGTVLWSPYAGSGLALVDLGGDGKREIVGVVYDQLGHCRAAAWRLPGAYAWLSDAEIPCGAHHPAVADLDGDGTVEIIVADTVFGADGRKRFTLPALGAPALGEQHGGQAFAVDLTGDGKREVVAGANVVRHDGAVLCAGPDGFAGAADLDGDGDGEIVVVADGRVDVWSLTGSGCANTASFPVDGGVGGPPLLADLTGDGAIDIGVVGVNRMSVYTPGGARRWSVPIDEPSGAAAAAAFDLDAGPDLEVIVGGASGLWILDGKSGATLYKDSSRASLTWSDGPVVADVDGDGAAEIVVGDSGAGRGLHALGGATSPWRPAFDRWNQAAFFPWTSRSDLTVSASPPRQLDGLRFAPSPGDAPDLRLVAWPEACQPGCGDEVTVVAAVANEGWVDVDADVSIVVWGELLGGLRFELARETLKGPFPAGQLTEAVEIDVPAEQALAYDALAVTLDAPATVKECDTGDGEVEVALWGVCAAR